MTGTEITKETLARWFLEECETLLELAWSNLRRLEEAEEAVQETAREAVRSLGSVRDPDLLPGWAFQTLEKVCQSRRRRRERQEKMQAPSALRGPGSTAQEASAAADYCWVDDLDEFVRQEVASLPPDLRVIAERGGMGGELLTALARELGVPRTLLAGRRNQAFEMLRPRLVRRMSGIQA